MIFLIIFIFPPLYKSGIISIYSFLGNRFGKGTTKILSGVFQFSRAFAAGITVYAVAIVLEAVFEIPLWINILITGLVALIYDYMGGMKAIVISDVIQMAILFVGFLICSYIAFDLIGGWHVFVENLDSSRLDAVSFSNLGIGDGEEFGFWPMLIGGFFLYTAYYGCDQSQAQRILSSKDMKNVRKALMFNGFCRFPTVLLYCGMGLLIGTFAMMTPQFLGSIPEGQSDYMVPVFIVEYLPNGLIGLLVAAILAAAMSSLDSALNSLSAATVQDFVLPSRKGNVSMDEQFRLSKKYTIVWGVICVLLAFSAGNIAPTVIEAINKIGSLFYGPIIATFVIAVLNKSIGENSMNIGILVGVLFNLILWLFFESYIFWFWWNATGFIVTVSTAWVMEKTMQSKKEKIVHQLAPVEFRLRETAALGAFFAVILTFSITLAFWL
jgi:SSS family transporter